MKEKIIREKNRTSMKKIVERAAAGWRLGAVESLDSGVWRLSDYGVRLFVVECGCWEKMIERNKINFFYLLGYYISLTLWVMGPGQVGALGRCPSCPGPGPGLNITIPLKTTFISYYHDNQNNVATCDIDLKKYFFPSQCHSQYIEL